MKTIHRILLAASVVALAVSTGFAGVSSPANSTVGIGGYDLVSYHTGAKPLRGNGNHLVVHEGVTYLFASEANRATFEGDPARYLPAYGGYCAYGVSVGKKFVGDPDVWEVVDGRLYVNLDNSIKGLWLKDVPGNLAKAEANWPKIAPRDPAEL